MRLGCAPVSVAPVMGVTGTAWRTLYPVRVAFPGTQIQPLEFQAITSVQLAAQGYVALIGRDLLAFMLMIYDGRDGRYTITF